MTLRELIIKGIGWLGRHPKSIVGVFPSPITRGGVRTTYNTENSVTDFDEQLRVRIVSLDGSYSVYSSATLQSMIDDTLPENEDITLELPNLPPDGVDN